jgi:hypothetical protein
MKAHANSRLKMVTILILIFVLIASTTAITLDDMSPSCDPTVARIFKAVGGKDKFETEVKNAVSEASSLRGGIPASLIDFKVTRAIVAKICFLDGICWAAKIQEECERATLYGVMAMLMVEKYCPHIPMSKYKGYKDSKLQFIFTEWIEGKTLADEAASLVNLGPTKWTYTIPEKLIIPLAEFVYNLTTCPILKTERKTLAIVV